MKIKRVELEQMINECVLELLESNDPNLIELLKSNDANNGSEITESFVEETKKVLKEHLGINEEDELELEAPTLNDNIIAETKRMKTLMGLNENEN